MVFTNIINPRSAVNRKNSYVPTIVEKGASIRPMQAIICGNRIGRYSFVGAGAVVTKDVKTLCSCAWKSCKADRLDERIRS